MCKLEQPDPDPVGLSRAAVREVPGVQRPARGGRPLLMTGCTVDAGKERTDSLFLHLPNLLCALVQASEFVPAELLCLVFFDSQLVLRCSKSHNPMPTINLYT